jgi:glycosyltransferase involved in cell wall biosynthesis
MKFLFIAPRFHTNQHEIVKKLRSVGHEVYFLVNTRGNIENYSIIEPIILPESFFSKIIGILSGHHGVNKKWYFPKATRLFFYLVKLKPEVVIIRCHGLIFNYMSALCVLLLRGKVIFYDQLSPSMLKVLHTGSFNSFLRWLNFYIRLYIFNAIWVTPIPTGLGNPGTLPKRCYFLPFAVHVPFWYKVMPYTKIPRILNISKYQERKNHQLLLEVLSKIKKEYKFECTLVGEVATSQQRAIKHHIERHVAFLGLENIVTFLDNVPHSEIQSVYESHDLFVLPATNEPASISVLEALGHGLPVVCSETCGTSAYVRHGVTGLKFKDNCHESLYNSLSFLLSNSFKRHIMSQQAHADAKKYFSGDSYYDSLKEIIQIP